MLERGLVEGTMPVRSAAYDKAHTLPDGTIDYRRTRVYEKEIAVRPGQIVDVRGEMHTHAANGLTARAYIGSTILLVADPVLHAQNPGLRTHPADQYVTGHNGFNCRAGQDCVTKKLGAVVVGPDAPPTMTVVYVAHAIYAREQDPAAVVKIRPCQAAWPTCGLEVVVRDPGPPPAADPGPACGDGQCSGYEDDTTCPADCGCAAVACAGVAPLGCYCDPGCSATGDCCADAASCQ